MPQETKSMPDGPADRGPRRQGDVVRGQENADDFRQAIDDAVDYRGDVTVSLRDGRSVEGYLFDRVAGADPAGSWVRILRASDGVKERIPCGEIVELRFSGKDTAAGKTWENWLRRYAEKRFRGEAASIESEIAD